MAHQHRNQIAARMFEPSADTAIDDLLIDDAIDDFLDRHVAAIRASLADCRYL